MELVVGSKNFDVALEDNESAKAVFARLPLSLHMDSMMHEKYFYFDKDFPCYPLNVQTIKAGDIMLYGSNCLVVFYESFRTFYSYTRLGHIVDCEGLKEALDQGEVNVVFKENR